MVHASLFSGIGGPEVAARMMGWVNAFHCEINQFGRRILDYHFPESESYEDITKTDFRKWRGKIDVLTGGFPCQPFSVAGRRKGAEDDRYLWPQFIRVIREVRPDWVVGENVAGILTMVQSGEAVNMVRSSSLFGDGYEEEETRQQYVVETICRDLESEGYSVQPFVIPACAVGAPHRRDRVFFVAKQIIANCTDAGVENVQQGREDGVLPNISAPNSESGGGDRKSGAQGGETWGQDGELPAEPCVRCEVRVATHSECIGSNEVGNIIQPGQSDGNRTDLQGSERVATDTESQQGERDESEQRDNCKQKQWKFGGIGSEDCEYKWSKNFWTDFPTTEPAVRRGDDGISGRLDGISFSKWRQESLKAYGNAIVPQVMYEIFRAIEIVENEIKK